jgi:hypothetical protein
MPSTEQVVGELLAVAPPRLRAHRRRKSPLITTAALDFAFCPTATGRGARD